MEAKKFRYINRHDDNVIEFVKRLPKASNATRKANKEDVLVFNYVESNTKLGSVEFKESDFKKYLLMGSFNRIC